MKLTTIILITIILQVSAKSYAQKITLAEKNNALSAVFEKISKQTGYDFLVSTENLKRAKPVSVNVVNEDLKQTLDKIFIGQPLAFVIQEKMVVVSAKETGAPLRIERIKTIPISGKVIDEKGQPLPGVTVRLLNSGITVSTDHNGLFTIAAAAETGTITFSFIGFTTRKMTFDMQHPIPPLVTMVQETGTLDAIQIIGYGETTKRFNTGSISSISANVISEQPVTNIQSALSGRMPGVFIQTTNGLPGGNINIQVRGKGSLAAGTTPLYVVDGIPFDGSSTTAISQFPTKAVNGIVSPLNSLNPDDIEDITVLKDADATSIYGSRGSNGVILITTKKGKSGNDQVNIKFSRGISVATSAPEMLGLSDYLAMRKEAYANDKLIPTTTGAPDLLAWDQSQDNNWAKYLLGRKASVTDVQTSVSGGKDQNAFNISANMHQEGNVISSEADYLRGGLRVNLTHHSGKFGVTFNSGLVLDDNRSPNLENIGRAILLPPNFPLTDANGLNTLSAGNPLIDLNSRTRNKTNNLLTSLVLNYDLTNDLAVKVSSGYNRFELNQQRLFPQSSVLSGTNYSQFLTNARQSMIVEPQLSYKRKNIAILLGGTYQHQATAGQFLQVSNFSNEGLLENFASAATVDVRSNVALEYKYVSVFGRVNYNLNNEFVFNLTARRDGSSRFGPDERFGNFWAAGAAWIFSEEDLLKKQLSVLSFGKLRLSYGLTGNDQIPDYQYLSTYQSSGRTYQGISALTPARISNNDFHWETTAKIEIGLELGFFTNRLSLDIDAYRNRSRDQLVNYTLPASTGFATYQANLPAVIENSGLELSLNTVNLKNKSFSWTSTINLTLPENKLLSFDNLASSGYAQTYVIGYDITRVKGYQLLGVDPQTGNAIYGDQNGNTATSTSAVFNNATLGKTTPDFYGGVGNTLSYKGLSLSVFFQGVKQHLPGGISFSAGQRFNSYAYVLNRWRQPGDITNVPRASSISDANYSLSSGNFFDASYIRLKSVSLNYHFNKMTFSLQAENLVTFWKHVPLADPESGALTGTSPALPPLRTITAGINFNF